MRSWKRRHIATVTVGHRRYNTNLIDDHGNRRPGWDEPVDITDCVLAPTTATEPVEAGRTPSITTMTLYAPPGSQISEKDLIVLPDGEEWTVEGKPAYWPPNPFTGSPTPGNVVVLRRAEG